MVKTKLLGVAVITFAVVSPAHSQTGCFWPAPSASNGGYAIIAPPRSNAAAIKNETSAARAEEEQPDVFAGFDDEMAARNAGKESGDIEFPVDWHTFNELEAEAREQRTEEDLASDRERFGESPKREAATRARRDRWDEMIRERVGPPSDEKQTVREPGPGVKGPTYDNWPNPISAGRYSSWGTNEALRIIDAEQDIRQDREEDFGR
jgi:hypothetical protein